VAFPPEHQTRLEGLFHGPFIFRLYTSALWNRYLEYLVPFPNVHESPDIGHPEPSIGKVRPAAFIMLGSFPAFVHFRPGSLPAGMIYLTKVFKEHR
jgi:hypothetical protein